MTATIFLIVEDQSDANVVRAILDARGIAVPTTPLVPSKGGVSRLVKELSRLIETARRKCKPEDCIAVVHDADEFVQPDRQQYIQIKQICEQRGDVVEIIAHDEIEAWLLANEGLCIGLAFVRPIVIAKKGPRNDSRVW